MVSPWETQTTQARGTGTFALVYQSPETATTTSYSSFGSFTAVDGGASGQLAQEVARRERVESRLVVLEAQLSARTAAAGRTPTRSTSTGSSDLGNSSAANQGKLLTLSRERERAARTELGKRRREINAAKAQAARLNARLGEKEKLIKELKKDLSKVNAAAEMLKELMTAKAWPSCYDGEITREEAEALPELPKPPEDATVRAAEPWFEGNVLDARTLTKAMDDMWDLLDKSGGSRRLLVLDALVLFRPAQEVLSRSLEPHAKHRFTEYRYVVAPHKERREAPWQLAVADIRAGETAIWCPRGGSVNAGLAELWKGLVQTRVSWESDEAVHFRHVDAPPGRMMISPSNYQDDGFVLLHYIKSLGLGEPELAAPPPDILRRLLYHEHREEQLYKLVVKVEDESTEEEDSECKTEARAPRVQTIGTCPSTPRPTHGPKKGEER